MKRLENKEYMELLNESIISVLKRALGICLSSPKQLLFIFKTIHRQIKAAKLRAKQSVQGLQIPSFMIMSITSKCNLKCKGCYATVNCTDAGDVLSTERQRNILEEAQGLGISIVLIAGGEPLTQENLLNTLKDFPKLLFPLFTNGLLIDEEAVKSFKTQKNIIPIISLEGEEKETDDRRGIDVYKKIGKVFQTLKKDRIFFGTSITVTSSNFNIVTRKEFILDLISKGCKLFIFVEYVPAEEGTEHLELDSEQKTRLKEFSDLMWNSQKAIFIAFPGDEEKFGGCLASGRGFIHINPHGGVEPCPFSPYSDSNLNNMSLKEALGSKLLFKIRQNHDKLSESSSGCALWDNRKWVSSLLDKQGGIEA